MNSETTGCCACCGNLVGFLDARPRILRDGHVSLICRPCDAGAAPAIVEEFSQRLEVGPAGAGPGRAPRWFARATGIASVGAALLLATLLMRQSRPEREARASALPPTSFVRTMHIGPARAAHVGEPLEQELDPSERGDSDRGVSVDQNGVPLDLKETLDRYPSLGDWIHPVIGTNEPLPSRSTRRFGAARAGVDREECGRGHCGVDLGSPRGTSVVAVSSGIVTRIDQRTETRAGKYVRVTHPDGAVTTYMHLDEVDAELAVGAEIPAGTRVGALGATGVHHSAPHLHFGLEFPRGDSFEFVDPAGFLVGAQILAGN